MIKFVQYKNTSFHVVHECRKIKTLEVRARGLHETGYQLVTVTSADQGTEEMIRTLEICSPEICGIRVVKASRFGKGSILITCSMKSDEHQVHVTLIIPLVSLQQQDHFLKSYLLTLITPPEA
jgi:hypothetical protein